VNFVDGLDMDKVNSIVSKGEDPTLEAYSAFVDVWGMKPTELKETLSDAKVTTVFVVGLGSVPC